MEYWMTILISLPITLIISYYIIKTWAEILPIKTRGDVIGASLMLWIIAIISAAAWPASIIIFITYLFIKKLQV